MLQYNCTKLTKITILDNVNDMGLYGVSDTDSIFENHNEDLTIYCYENTMAANYAIKYNIKYVYLERPDTDNPGDVQEPGDNNSGNAQNPEDDNTIAPGNLPNTGASTIIIIAFIMITIILIVSYKKYNNYKDI